MPPAAAWTSTTSPALSGRMRVQHELDREALQEDGGGRLVVDIGRQRDHQRRRHGADLRIGADRLAGIDDAVAGRRWVTPGPTSMTVAGRLHARDAGRLEQVEETGPAIDVDEIDPDRRMAEPDFAGTGRRDADHRGAPSPRARHSVRRRSRGFRERPPAAARHRREPPRSRLRAWRRPRERR